MTTGRRILSVDEGHRLALVCRVLSVDIDIASSLPHCRGVAGRGTIPAACAQVDKVANGEQFQGATPYSVERWNRSVNMATNALLEQVTTKVACLSPLSLFSSFSLFSLLFTPSFCLFPHLLSLSLAVWIGVGDPLLSWCAVGATSPLDGSFAPSTSHEVLIALTLLIAVRDRLGACPPCWQVDPTAAVRLIGLRDFPRPGKKLHLDLSGLIGVLFYLWILQLLIPSNLYAVVSACASERCISQTCPPADGAGPCIVHAKRESFVDPSA